jgi:hypothetical protein
MATARSASFATPSPLTVIGRDHRLALSDQHAQPDVIAFRALGFLDASIADSTPCETPRTATASAASAPALLAASTRTLRQRAQGGLIEQV